MIAAVSESASAAQITIQGVGFGKRTPLVQLAGTRLAVASASNTEIVIQLPSTMPPGSYLPFVQNGATHLVGQTRIQARERIEIS